MSVAVGSGSVRGDQGNRRDHEGRRWAVVRRQSAGSSQAAPPVPCRLPPCPLPPVCRPSLTVSLTVLSPPVEPLPFAHEPESDRRVLGVGRQPIPGGGGNGIRAARRVAVCSPTDHITSALGSVKL